MYIIFGLVALVVGLFLVIKTDSMLDMFGRVGFFEKHLGAGGSRLGYKLVGIFVIFLGILSVTGSIEGFILWVLSPLISLNQRGM